MWILFFFLIKSAISTPLIITDQCIDICKNAQLPALELVMLNFYIIYVFKRYYISYNIFLGLL